MNLTSNRGQNPSAIACLTIENIPVISACEAMNAAMAEITMSTPRMIRSTSGSPVLRREGVERVRPRRDPLLEQVADLPRVVEQQARQDQAEPREHHGAPARIPRVEALPLPHLRLAPAREVADVGVLRLAPRDGQDHDAEDDEDADPGEAGQEPDRVRRVERQEDLGMPDDPGEALEGDPGEPDQHHEPAEEAAHLARAPPLGLEEDEQADERSPRPPRVSPSGS